MFKNENIKRIAAISLFWGSLWGIAEATLGYTIHLFKFFPGVAGFVMFPIGFYFMNRAYRESGSVFSLFSTSAAAAVIKLVDLFLPGLSPIYTLNPALAILMEGAAVMIVFRLLKQNQKVFRFREALLAAAGWRAAFIIHSFILLMLSISSDFFQKGTTNIIRFFVLDSLVNAVFITVYLAVSEFLAKKHPVKHTGVFNNAFHKRLSLSFLMFAIAVFTRLILNKI
ncbi:MAG: hypothetical protein MUF15_09385 [Acidobacteria bacterium]|jgi:hypothetical protein|nr:hypothetical protein [Acidobacteriota bacterium]